jgi:uncharacterized protein (DUF885 family)
MSTTYDLLRDADRLLAALDDAGGELTAESEAAWAAWLAAGGAKLESLHAVTKRAKSQADALAEDEASLAARRKALGRVQERCKALAFELLVAHREMYGEAKLSLPTFTVWLQASARVIGPEDVEDWPEAFRRSTVTVTPDKEGAKEALRRGESVPGVRLETNESVRWK